MIESLLENFHHNFSLNSPRELKLCQYHFIFLQFWLLAYHLMAELSLESTCPTYLNCQEPKTAQRKSITSLFSYYQRGFLQEQMGVGAETQQPDIIGSLNWRRWLLDHSLGDQGTTQKMGRKDFRSQKGWRTPEDHVPLNNLIRFHRNWSSKHGSCIGLQ